MKSPRRKAPRAPRPKRKKKPHDRQWKIRNNLQDLAACGVGGEATVAAAKLAELESKYDFSGQRPESAKDLFHGIEVRSALGECREIATFGAEDAALADFVKWAICSRFNVQGRWRDDRDGDRTLFLEVCRSSVAGLHGLAVNMAAAFAELWRTFSALPGATPADARLFMRGVYDGCMGDERAAGEMLPPRNVQPAPKGRKRKALALAPGLSIHPYAVAVDLGRKVRVSIPAVELAAELRDTEQRARLAAPNSEPERKAA